MKVSMAYKYRLNVNKKQKQLLLNHIFAHNQTWNILLNNFEKESEINLIRKDQGLEPIYTSDTDKDKLVKSILKHRNINYNVQVIQQTRIEFMKNLIYTLKEIKKSNPNIGKLKFKQSKNFNNQGFKTTKNQYNILDTSNPKYKILRLFKQNFKIRWSRDLPDNAKLTNVTISFKDNHFYASFNISYDSNTMVDNLLTECNKQSIACKKNIDTSYLKPLGIDINIDSIDLGNKLFHKVFNIKDIKTNNLIKKNEKKIKRLKRKQSRRVKRSLATKTKLGKNFKKTQNKINKISTKNSNIKVFNLHRLVNDIIKFLKDNQYNHIIMEDLNVKSMTAKDNVNKTIGKKSSKTMKKNILHISFAMFKNILTYKCAISGVYVSLVDPKNTSKMCSSCGNINKDLNITNRIYECKECGLKLKRDHNSCINMINKFNK